MFVVSQQGELRLVESSSVAGAFRRANKRQHVQVVAAKVQAAGEMNGARTVVSGNGIRIVFKGGVR